MTGQTTVIIDDTKRGQLLRDATKIAIGDLGIVPIRYEGSTRGIQKSPSCKARSDQYTRAMDVRPR